MASHTSIQIDLPALEGIKSLKYIQKFKRILQRVDFHLALILYKTDREAYRASSRTTRPDSQALGTQKEACGTSHSLLTDRIPLTNLCRANRCLLFEQCRLKPMTC